MKKLGIGFIVLSLGLSVIYFSQVLVTASILNPSPKIEVEHYDVLTWQAQRELDILEDYQSQSYPFEAPYVLLDPYDMNPLSALVLFEASQAGDYTIVVQGHDELSTLTYTLTRGSGLVQLPILGLYPGELNEVTIHTLGQEKTLWIQTDGLPIDFQTYSLIESKPDLMESGMTLMIACFEHSYTAVIDHNAQVRAYFSDQRIAHGTSILSLANGNLMVTGDEYKQIPYTMTSLWEINWLGKIFKEYEIPNAVHHDLFELPNGDILAASNYETMFQSGTREDVAIVIDRQEGTILQTYNFRDILDETRAPFNHFDPGIIHGVNLDWLHMNTVLYEPNQDVVIVSSPIQSQVIAVDASTHEIQWILGPHEGYEGYESYEAYLLEPIGDEFDWAWGQHHPMVLADQDDNDQTLDILLFDNGQSRSFEEASALLASENYSRAVQYRIDTQAMTVEQIWSYGEPRGSELYSTFLGDADYLADTHNVLISFGGHLTQDGTIVDEIIGGVVGSVEISSTVVEVNQAKEVVFEVHVQSKNNDTSAETYQAERIDFFQAESFNTDLGTWLAQRVGTSYEVYQDTETKLPNIFFGDMDVAFNDLVIENDRLIVDGVQSYQGNNYLLSQTKIVLRSSDDVFIFNANSALNGRFFASIDLSVLPKGEYLLQMAGGVLEGNDTQAGDLKKAYYSTDYSITIDE